MNIAAEEGRVRLRIERFLSYSFRAIVVAFSIGMVVG